MIKICFKRLTNLIKFLFSFIVIYLIYLLIGILPTIISIIFNINIDACENLIFGFAFILLGIFTYNLFKPLIKVLKPNKIEIIMTKAFFIIGSLAEIFLGISLASNFFK